MVNQSTPPRRAKVVTIVEDHASLRTALAFAFEADGFIVHAFPTARPLLNGPPEADCLIIEMRLPDHDGLGLVSLLRKMGVWTPVILIATNPDPRVRKNARDMGVRIVEKPLITSELRRRVDELIAVPVC